MKRDQFLKLVATGAGILAHKPIKAFEYSIDKKIRVGVIGTGLRGQDHIELLLMRTDVQIVALCDIDPIMIANTKELFVKAKQTVPPIFDKGKEAWLDLLKSIICDAIIIATPWEWHKPMIIGAMESGVKYIGSEVVLGLSLEDHFEVVRKAEQYKAHVMMLENVCYRRDVMAVLQMVREGIFGELIHLQGGYQHDLRAVKFNDGVHPYGQGVEFGNKGFSEARWRTEHSVQRNGDLYPTHGIGPIAQMININRGNRFLRLNSFSSKSRGLSNYIEDQSKGTHPNKKVQFKLGDVVTTQIACANGETILLQHDTSLPRPYSLGFRVQGTKGLWMDVNKSIYIEGTSAKPHQWEDTKAWFEKYDHPLWKKYANAAQGAGHGGMDFYVLHAFIEAVKRGEPTPMDVYDAAAWSAITPLSETSISLGNETVDFPDFTNGQWMYRKPIFALNDDY